MDVALGLPSIRRRLGATRAASVDERVERRAAVAAILRPAGVASEVLLIRRADNPGDPWSGHMAFPGGRAEPEDPDLVATAIRETREEVGLSLSEHAELLGRLDDLRAIGRRGPTGLVIRPFVFALRADVTPTLNAEVAEVLWAPLSPLARGEVDTTRPYTHQGQTLEFPAYDVDGRLVWGLTYRMLQNLFEALRG